MGVVKEVPFRGGLFVLAKFPPELALDELTTFLADRWSRMPTCRRQKDGTRASEFSQGDLTHKLRVGYFGNWQWKGYEATVFKRVQPVWQLSYECALLAFPNTVRSDKQKTKFAAEATNILTDMLLKYTPKDLPLRGPMNYISPDKRWEYANQIKGDIHQFKGIEHIHFSPAGKDSRMLILEEKYEGGTINTGEFIRSTH